MPFSIPSPPESIAALYRGRLKALFARMDRAYDRIADACGFVCRGCDDNCCTTRFYHHTLIEYLYLQQGVAKMPQDQRRAAQEQGRQVLARYRQADAAGTAVRAMCPINVEGRCGLYVYRPMICRLHGIPHQLDRPGGRLHGPGCADFDRQSAGRPAVAFNRTPLYRDMALLEQELRAALGIDSRQRIKYAIADVVVDAADTRIQNP